MTDERGRLSSGDDPPWGSLLSGLVQQLEPAKFARLLRHLLDDPRATGDMIRKPAEPIAMPNSELLVKEVARRSGHGYDRSTWIFRPIHLPVHVWSAGALSVQLDAMVEAAFSDIAANRELLKRIHGVNDVDNRYEMSGWGRSGDQILYPFTNVAHDISDESVTASVKRWIELWERHLPGVARPRFGLGSPETMVAGSARETIAFIKEVLREPSGYQVIAQDGRITVSEFTEHGSFVSAERRSEGGAALATATATLRSRMTRPVVQAFEDLLNRPGTRERDLQAFLEEEPSLLGALDARFIDARPRVTLASTLRAPLIPDFLIRLDDPKPWALLELKGPNYRAVKYRAAVASASARTAAALDQLLRYRDFFHDPANRQRMAPLLGAAPFQPLLAVVIGRGDAERRLTWSGGLGLPDVSIVSYDYLLEHAKRSVAGLHAESTIW